MANVNVTVTNNIPKQNRRINMRLKNLPKEAYNFFKSITPIKTGNARNKTKLSGQTIQANYPYAEVLDKGRHMTNRGMRGSDQAPQGMSKPTEEFIKQRIAQILAGK